MRAVSPQRGRNLVDFEHYGFGGLLNIQDGEQEMADNELRSAINVYGATDGDIEMRRGMNVRGPLCGSGAGQGLFRFVQNIANGAIVANKRTIMQVAGTLFDADTNAQLSATGALGVNAKPMSAVLVFDNQHPTSPPSPSAAAAAGGSLVASTYAYVVTSNTPGGESLPSQEVAITTTSTGSVMLSWAAVPGATSYDVYGRTPGGEQRIAHLLNALTFTDNGSVTPSGTAPTTTTATIAASDVLIICTGVGGPYVYDGSITYTYAGGPTSVAGARWCAMVNNVLYFSGIPSQPNLIVASRVGFPEQLPGYALFTTSRPVTGLGTIGQGLQTSLVAGMVRGIALLSGITPNSYIEMEIPSEDGVQAGRTMVTIDGVLYFLGTNAIYRYDGTRFVEISRKVRKWIVNDPTQPAFPMNANDRGATSWAMYARRKIYFWYASSSSVPNTALVWDIDLEGWTIYTGVTLNAGCELDAPGDPDPHGVVVVDATKGQQYLFDVYADAGFNVSDAGATIRASFLTKSFKIGTPGAPKRLLRTSLEFFALLFSGAFTVLTDYGVSQIANLAVVPATNVLIWDVGSWDVNVWASSALAYTKQRQDWNLSAEAFAFGLQTPTINITGAYTGWRFMGVTGRLSQYPRI